MSEATRAEAFATDPLDAFDPDVFAQIGVPIAAVFRSLHQLRGLLENEGAGVTQPLVDAAFTQAHMLSVATIIAHGRTDDDQDEAMIAAFAARLRETVAIARIL